MIWNTSISRRTVSLFPSIENDNFIEYQRSNQNDIKIIFPCFIPCVFHTHNSALYQCMFWKSELLCKNAMFSFLFAFWFQETPGWQFETTMHCQCTKWTRIFIMSRFFFSYFLSFGYWKVMQSHQNPMHLK